MKNLVIASHGFRLAGIRPAIEDNVAKRDKAAPVKSSERSKAVPSKSSGRGLIQDEVVRQQIVGEKLRIIVSKAIQDAQALRRSDPDSALEVLQSARTTVNGTVDASLDLRQQLNRQVQREIDDLVDTGY